MKKSAECLASGAKLPELPPSIKHRLELCASCQAQLDDWCNELEKSQISEQIIE
ncbi:MAG: hypothetical protein JW862_16630 [Anaerolineales bacterium]|nr:hypothetical protein [Anaerolineales bacterium]